MSLKNTVLMVEGLKKEGILRTSRIIEAFEYVDRADFLPSESKNLSHMDTALPIGYDQTNSQPYVVAFMLELLQPDKGDRILDIGSGSGWTTALLAKIAGLNGDVLGLEIIPELVNFGQMNLFKYGFKQAWIDQAGADLGRPGEEFDCILVSAAAKKFPDELVDQLYVGGRLVIPVKQSIFLIRKKDTHSIITSEYPGFVFVPLKEKNNI